MVGLFGDLDVVVVGFRFEEDEFVIYWVCEELDGYEGFGVFVLWEGDVYFVEVGFVIFVGVGGGDSVVFGYIGFFLFLM